MELTDPELARHAARVAADGFTVLEDAIDAQHLDELASEVARLTAELGERRDVRRLRKLAGFGLYKRMLGHIDKCSPEDLLDGTGPRPIVGKLG